MSDAAGIEVLLVEDDRDLASVLTMFLKHQGITAEVAIDCASAKTAPT